MELTIYDRHRVRPNELLQEFAAPVTTHFDRLSEKRRSFIEIYITNGFNARAAYDQVFSPGKNATVSHHRASELLRRPDVRMAIAEKLAELRELPGMSREEVVARLTAVGRDPKHRDHVKALQTLAKIHGLLDTTLNLNMTVTDARNAVEAEIARILGGGGEAPIDVEAKLLSPAETGEDF